MVATVTSFRTTGIPACQRVSHLLSTLEGHFGPVEFENLGPDPIDGHINQIVLPKLRLYHMEGGRNRITHLPAGYSPSLSLRFQTQGTSVFEQAGREITIGPGDCLLYEQHRPFRFTSPGQTALDLVVLPKDMLRRRGVDLDQLDPQRLPLNFGAHLAHDLLKSVMNSNFADVTDEMTDSIVGDVLLNLLLLALREQSFKPGLLTKAAVSRARAKTFIQDHLDDPELTIDQVADVVGVTKRYLHMLFQEEGMTVSRYIWQSRLARCREALESKPADGQSVTEIAFAWGFSSSSHFTRLFKKEFGLTPSALKLRSSIKLN